MKEKTLEVELDVTQKDIDRGVAGDPWECPLARAFNRAVKKRKCEVGDSIGIGDVNYITPSKLLKFIKSFDDFERVKPFKAVLNLKEIPQP